MSAGTGDPASVQIVPVSAQDIREDQLGNIPDEWARLARDEFRKDPWHEYYDVTRLAAGLGIDISRLNAESRIARTQEGYHIGHVMVYEVRPESDLPTILSLEDISGNTELNSLFERGRVAYIDSIVVREGFQGFGVGRRLLTEAIEAMRAHGIDLITLRTHVRARRARNLFSGLGFTDTGIRDSEYPDRTYWVLELN